MALCLSHYRNVTDCRFPVSVHHDMEPIFAGFPHYGKNVFMPWKPLSRHMFVEDGISTELKCFIKRLSIPHDGGRG